MIDLDHPADRAEPPRPPARVAVVALLIGAVLGGLVADRWAAHRRRTADDATVSVLLFGDRLVGDYTATTDVEVTTHGRTRAVSTTVRTGITVVNAGPRPVRIAGLTAHSPGLTLTGAGDPRWIPAGTSFLVEADLTRDCAATGTAGITEVSVSVEKRDGTVASLTPVSLDSSAWQVPLQAVLGECALYRPDVAGR
jgi:hypothetical protein